MTSDESVASVVKQVIDRFGHIDPPAWIGVGTLDLFHHEDVEYARRLGDSGVPCELDVIPGALTASNSCFPRPRSGGSSGAGRQQR
ncbi:alpha/beta hydrolase fold domain-containing protein [Streptomyces canus]|uniref:alpha/beta hydrolase fold domain-containing protein n=1 Tax=Streptomyces canus TaxID=58343 RepID=UPI0036A86E24